MSALEFGKLFEKAGFPPGVVNIVTGFGNEIGEPLVSHPRVAKVAFTGGDRTGQSVYELAARSIKPVTLELGGKSANIVFDDAELDDAVKGVVSGIFAATGQTCIAGSRALVHRSIHDRFVDELLALARTAQDGQSAGHRDAGRPDHHAAAISRKCWTISTSPRAKARSWCWAARPRRVRNAATAGSSSRRSSPT